MRIDVMFRFPIFLIFLFAANVSSQTFYGSTDLKTFRDGRDAEFRNRTESPLTEPDFETFRGLKYFANAPKYRVIAQFTKTPSESYFLMPTSTGVAKKFKKFGELRFKLNGMDLMLNAYQIDVEILEKFPQFADLIFVPFKDLTNGSETYGVGRYIDIKRPSGGTAILDFNLAYNPNCAYGSDKYACPIPPRQNHLKVAIRAGEKVFRKAESNRK